MPQWRKLHTKIVQSLDYNEMSSDFVRLTWAMLPLCCCREGRGLYNGSWLRSNLYPLRDDVKAQMMIDAMNEFVKLEMIVLYRHGRRGEYFQIVQWHEHQGSTSKEASSTYPSPDDGKLFSSSGLSPDLVQSKSGLSQTDIVKYRSTSESTSKSILPKKVPKKTKLPPPSITIPESINTPAFKSAWEDFIEHRKEIKSAMTPRAANMQLKKLSEFTPSVAVAMLEQSIANGWKGVFDLKQQQNGNQRTRQSETKHASGRL